MIRIIKKDKTLETYNEQKIINACKKASMRALDDLNDNDYKRICENVMFHINEKYPSGGNIPVSEMHSIVEKTLMELYPNSGQAYRQYRNYKVDFVHMLDDVYQKSQTIKYIGDVSNANTDSAMVSTQRSLIYGQLNKNLYQKFFLNKKENQAINDGYIYIHDMKDRLDSINCCLFDMNNILKDGFEMGNIWYNEPKTLDVAFDVISDVAISAASQQYGGFTIPRVDKILSPYVEKSFHKYYEEYLNVSENSYDALNLENILNLCKYPDGYIGEATVNLANNAAKYAYSKIYRDLEQGFQSWEYRFNTLASSRGDYPFIAISFGLADNKFEEMIIETILKVRMNGQGKKGFKKPVLFPKLTFLYDENLHGENGRLEYLFDLALECSSKTMYPDFLSLTGEGYIPSIYKKYGQVVSLMGCRASLSPWYVKGGMHPADDTDYPVFEGRCNLGAISLHLPMILAKARQEDEDFYNVLDYYLEMIRNLHKRTYDFLGEKVASTNPLAFTQGGLLNGYLKPDDKIKPLLKPMTMSFGITALNELQELYNGQSLVEDGTFALEVMQYINDYIDRIKEEDGILYAVYGTPAESLCGLQIEQFRKKYGIIEGVSDKAYVSNSFHCGVWEEITPIQKQNLEKRFWDYFNGGKIQYCRYPVSYNHAAQKSLVRRAMDMGFYEGCNLALSFCEDCGHEQLEMNICPKCNSENITQIDRMNGYIGYTKIHGKSRYNQAKVIEISERKSM